MNRLLKHRLPIFIALFITVSPVLADTTSDHNTSPDRTASTHEVTGLWRSIDDKTGYAKSLIKIEQSSDGSYGGTVVQVLSHPGYTPEVYCQNCPAPFTDKPIAGLHLLWGLKANPDDHTLYSGGRILDPLSGHLYSAKITLAPDGKKLTLRGYMGISLLGRSQVWIREQEH